MIAVLAAVVLALGACSSSKPAPEIGAAPAPPHAAGIDLPGDANGLYWDGKEGALYLTDATHGNVLRWTQAAGFAPVAKLPDKIEPGGIVRLADGRFVITSFGFGKDGAVFVIAPGQAAAAVPALDPARRRIGLAIAPDGTLYDTYFVVGEGKHRGGLARLDLTAGETDVPAGNLAKPVGVAITDRAIYVSDQEQGAIYAVQGGAAVAVASGLASADLLTVLPDGALVTGGTTGVVTRIGLDGKTTALASGFEQVRGTAYDPVGKRLYVVEHSKATSSHQLHVVQL